MKWNRQAACKELAAFNLEATALARKTQEYFEG
jgi:hypothetical protein